MAALFFYSDFIGFSCGTFTSIITKSDEVREYGATVFLKWLTSKEQNTRFTLKTGYLPVKNDVYNEDSLLREVSNLNIKNSMIVSQSMP